MTHETISVLLIDDDPSFRDVVSMHLERADPTLSTVAAESPAAGLELLDERRVDCVVSDYEMPEMDGLDFLRAVRTEYPSLPFVLYTGKGSEEIAAEAINAGVDAYYQKGAGTGQYPVLARHITTLVEKYRAERRLEHLAREKHIADGGVRGVVNADAEEDGDSLSLAVVEAVAAREGVDPVALTPPLHDVVDPDAVEALFAARSEEHDPSTLSLTFDYCGHEVSVSGDGRVAVDE